MVGTLIDFDETPAIPLRDAIPGRDAIPARDAAPADRGIGTDRRPGGAMRGILFGLAIVTPLYAVAAAVIFLL